MEFDCLTIDAKDGGEHPRPLCILGTAWYGAVPTAYVHRGRWRQVWCGKGLMYCARAFRPLSRALQWSHAIFYYKWTVEPSAQPAHVTLPTLIFEFPCPGIMVNS
jgi:hypothetical protein